MRGLLHQLLRQAITARVRVRGTGRGRVRVRGRVRTCLYKQPISIMSLQGCPTKLTLPLPTPTPTPTPTPGPTPTPNPNPNRIHGIAGTSDEGRSPDAGDSSAHEVGGRVRVRARDMVGFVST